MSSCQTREELRNALEDEIRAFHVDKDLSTTYEISWNHQEFEVPYPSLAEEIKIGTSAQNVHYKSFYKVNYKVIGFANFGTVPS